MLVDVGTIVDLVHEVLCGVDSVLEFVLGLLIIIDAREDTWTCVLAVHHETLLLLAEVPPDEAECVLEKNGPVPLKDDKKLVVSFLGKHLIIDEGHDLLSRAVIFVLGPVFHHHLDVVVAFQEFK